MYCILSFMVLGHVSSVSLKTSVVLGVNAARQLRFGIVSTLEIEKSISLLFIAKIWTFVVERKDVKSQNFYQYSK